MKIKLLIESTFFEKKYQNYCMKQNYWLKQKANYQINMSLLKHTIIGYNTETYKSRIVE